MVARKMRLTGAKGYSTRMLKAGDDVIMPAPRARLYESMGWAEPVTGDRPSQLDPGDQSGTPPEDGNLAALRQEYLTKLGRRPFNAWDAATLRAKIAAA